MNGNPSISSKVSVSRGNVPRSGMAVWQLLLTGVALTVLVALLLPSVSRSRGAARRTQCKNNLKQIALALHNYESTYGSLPPTYTVDSDGKPLHSWRTLLLPFLDQRTLYESIDLTKAWDDPINSSACATAVPSYCCPSMPRPATQTTYRAIVARGSLLCPVVSKSLAIAQDRLSETWLVMEAPIEKSCHWMDPVDADEDLIAELQEKSQLAHAGGMYVCHADSTVQFHTISDVAANFRTSVTVASADSSQNKLPDVSSESSKPGQE